MMRRLTLTRTCAEDGFTFVEVMTVTMLLGIILAAAYLVMGTVSKVSDGIIARGQAQDQGQLAVEKMTRELRMAQPLYDRPPTQKRWRLYLNSGTTIQFYADVDHNGTMDRVTYNVANGQLTRYAAVATVTWPNIPYTDQFGANSTPKVLASVDPAITTVFSYLDANNAATFDQDSVCAVQIALRTVAKSGATSTSVNFPQATVDVRAFPNQ